MIEAVKDKIGQFLAVKKYLNRELEPVSFKDFMENSYDFLLLLPDNDLDFHPSLNVIYTISELKKNVTVFVRDYRVSLIKRKERISFIDYGVNDITKLKHPSERIVEILSSKKIDVVMDLNLEENFFCTIASSLSRAEFRISFQRGKTDKYYNLQIRNNEPDSDISYRNLLNSLQMF